MLKFRSAPPQQRPDMRISGDAPPLPRLGDVVLSVSATKMMRIAQITILCSGRSSDPRFRLCDADGRIRFAPVVRFHPSNWCGSARNVSIGGRCPHFIGIPSLSGGPPDLSGVLIISGPHFYRIPPVY